MFDLFDDGETYFFTNKAFPNQHQSKTVTTFFLLVTLDAMCSSDCRRFCLWISSKYCVSYLQIIAAKKKKNQNQSIEFAKNQTFPQYAFLGGNLVFSWNLLAFYPRYFEFGKKFRISSESFGRS